MGDFVVALAAFFGFDRFKIRHGLAIIIIILNLCEMALGRYWLWGGRDWQQFISVW